MRICLYVGKAAPVDKQEEWLANARSTCDVYASNLYREFTALGHEVVFASSLSARPNDCSEAESAKRLARYEKMEFPQADHAICLEQNGWRYRDSIFFEKARAATKGLICAICDHDNDASGPQDMLFTARRPAHPGRARYVGWAADPAVFTPEKDPEWLTIFVDHKYHAVKKADQTEELLKSATSFAARVAREDRRVGSGKRRVRVVFFSPDGIEVIDPSEVRNVDLGPDRRTFYRRVAGPELAAWTRKTDIFVVTHGESMGLPVLENAMAGALIVFKEGFVKPELIRSLGNHEFRSVEHLNWDELVDNLDPERFRRRALHFSWGQVANRMLETLSGRAQQPAPTPRREGSLLLAPPAAVQDRRLPDLAGWRSKSLSVSSGGDAFTITPTAGPAHLLRRDLVKNPWPECFTLSFTVRPNGRDHVVVWLTGEFDEERAEVRFNVDKQEASPGRVSNGWAVLDTIMVRLGDEVLCHLVVLSDWAPLMRCFFILARTESLEFTPEPEEQGLQVRSVRLSRGVGLIAEVGEPAGQSMPIQSAA